MDIKTFINQQIEKAEAEKEKLIEISGWDRFCPECETSYLEYEFFGKIEAYKNVLEFLDQQNKDQKHIEHMNLISEINQKLKEIDSKEGK